jgi:protein ImuB
VTHRAGNADHLHCLNLAASDRGLQRGMALADARAICPDLATRPSDLAREAAMLRQMRRWAGRYAPQLRWMAQMG